MTSKNSLRFNIFLIFLSGFLASLDFTRGIFLLYFQSKGMSLGQLGSLQTILFVSSLVFEYPAGLLADHLSRKKSVAVGLLILSFSGLAYVHAHAFSTLCLIFAIQGAGFACISGADTALLYDELSHAGEPWISRYLHLSGKLRMFCSLGISAAIICGGLIQRSSWDRVYYLYAIAMLAAFIAVVCVHESRFSVAKTKFDGQFLQELHSLNKTVYAFVRSAQGRALLLFIGAMALLEAVHTPYFIYGQLLLKDSGFSATAISLIIAAGFLSSSAIFAIGPIFRRIPLQRLILSGFLLTAFFVLSSAYISNHRALAIASFLLINGIPHLVFLYTDAYVTENFPQKLRASLLSIKALVTSLAIASSYYVGGELMAIYTPRIGLALLGVLPVAGAVLAIFYFLNARSLVTMPKFEEVKVNDR